MERQDLYLKPNAIKLALAIGFVVLLGIADIALRSNGMIKLVGVLLGILSIVGIPAAFIWLGWDGRRKMGYRWTDTLIASFANGSIVIVVLSFLIMLITGVIGSIQTINAANGRTPSTWMTMVASLLLYSGPTFFGLLGHAAAKYFGGNPAVKATEPKNQTKH